MMSDEPLISLDDSTSCPVDISIDQNRNCSDAHWKRSCAPSLLDLSSLPMVSFHEKYLENSCEDQTTENRWHYHSQIREEVSIQYSPSDILNLDDSTFFSFNASVSSLNKHFEENQLLENEKFAFGIPPEVLEEILKSPEASCNQKFSYDTVVAEKFSEITVRPPILSPPVYDPLEEIYQEARKIARRLSMHMPSLHVSEIETLSSCVVEKEKEKPVEQKTGSDTRNLIKKGTKKSPNSKNDNGHYQEQLTADVINADNKENCSKIANMKSVISQKASVLGLSKSSKKMHLRTLSSKLKKPLTAAKEKECLQKGFSTPPPATQTQKKGKGASIVRSSTFNTSTKSSTKNDVKNPGKPNGKAKVMRRRSDATTKQEIRRCQAETRERHSSGSSVSSCCSTVSSPAGVSTLCRSNISKSSTQTSDEKAKPYLHAVKQAKNASPKAKDVKPSADLIDSTSVRKPILMCPKSTVKVQCNKAEGAAASALNTPSRIRAPSKFATPKSAPKERVAQTTPLRIAPNFNVKM